MMLPKLSGPDVPRALRRDPRTASMPVIVLSSLPQSNEPTMLAEGATAYFAKSELRLDKGTGFLRRPSKSCWPRSRRQARALKFGIRGPNFPPHLV